MTFYISMPLSQTIPPSPSPTESKRLFYISVSLLLSHTQGYRYHLSKFHIYAFVYCIGVFLSFLKILYILVGKYYSILVAFAIHWQESATGAYVSSILNPISLPPHPIPPDCPSALALSALLHVSNLHWSSVLHMVIYISQCDFLKLCRPLLFPHSPKVCSLHLCLSFCLAYRIKVIIFLNSIYMY